MISSPSPVYKNQPIVWYCSVNIREIAHIANGTKLQLSPEAWERLRESRAVVEEFLATGELAYGLNTGLGSLKKNLLSPDELGQFNLDVIRSHAVALSRRELKTHEVRAVMAARVAGLIQGGSGVRPELAALLVDMLNAGVHPVIRPLHTSVGDSDLAPLAQMMLVLVGEGEADYQGHRYSGEEALHKAGLKPVVLQAKEGLGMVSAQAYSVGLAALYLLEAYELLDAFDIAAVYSLEGLNGNPNIIGKAATAGRPVAGQARRAERIRHLLEGSDLAQRTTSLQDPTSFRCVIQVHGACDESLSFVRKQIQALLNAQTDNPVVDIETRTLNTSGNFDGTALALASDMLRLAMQRLIVMSVERVNKLGWSNFTGLPTALADAKNADLGMTLNNASRSMTSAAARAHILAQPCSLTITPNITEGTDDYSSMAANGVELLGEHLELTRIILALEFLFGQHALRLRHAHPSASIAAVHTYVSSLISSPLRIPPYLKQFHLHEICQFARLKHTFYSTTPNLE